MPGESRLIRDVDRVVRGKRDDHGGGKSIARETGGVHGKGINIG